MSISPWHWSVDLPSPDGKWVATIKEAGEIAMGAPTCGRLRFSNGFTVEDCNPSMVWSADSRYLAVPQWTRDKSQCLLVVEPAARRFVPMPGRYRVLRLETFVDGVITGVDSPIHQPQALRVEFKPGH